MDDQPETPPAQTPHEEPVTYEETPVIEEPPKEQPHDVLQSEPPKPASPPPKAMGSKALGAVVTFLVFLLLFAGGVFLSGILRTYLAGQQVSEGTPTPTIEPASEMPIVPVATSSSGSASQDGWITYSVLSGVTKQAVPGIRFQLPSSVAPPACDGESCASQGTYLPGGTRFTIAARGEGQVFKDFRGSIISDLQGQAFTVGEVTVAGRRAVEFQGVFSGATANGGVFDQMHGMMIEVTDTLSLELNHFTPTGVSANFTQDDILFADIISRITLP